MLIMLPSGPVELLVPEAVHMPPPSSIELAGMIDVLPGETVLDLGCGAGLLAIAAAKLGAGRVVATDVLPAALKAVRENARSNGVADRIEVRSGSWFEALGVQERFEVIMATPPQTPGRRPGDPRYGGPDGAKHLVHIVTAAPAHLHPRRGRLWMLAISLANPARLQRELARRFTDLRLVRQTDRWFTAAEYEVRQDGLMKHLLKLRTAGKAVFSAAGEDWTYVFQNLFFRASRPRNTGAARTGLPVITGRDRRGEGDFFR